MSKLQELRKNKKLSQNELANITKLNKRLIQHYEQGTHDINGAGIDKLVPIAIALNCKISDILEDENLINLCKEIGI